MPAVLRIHRPLRVMLVVATILVAAMLLGAPAEAKVWKLKPRAATTDNYKASYNADPDAPENRTWLAMRALKVGKARWRPQNVHMVSGAATFPTVLRVRNPNGRGAILRIHHLSGPRKFAYFRVGPQRGWFGVFLQTRGVARLRKRPVVLRLVLRRKGKTFAARKIRYRYAPNITRRKLEVGGPHGRWWIGRTSTRTNLEAGRPR